MPNPWYHPDSLAPRDASLAGCVDPHPDRDNGGQPGEPYLAQSGSGRGSEVIFGVEFRTASHQRGSLCPEMLAPTLLVVAFFVRVEEIKKPPRLVEGFITFRSSCGTSPPDLAPGAVSTGCRAS